MKKVLVTGADGFIGRHLVNKLLTEGKEVFGVVPPDSCAYENRNDARLHICCMDLNEATRHIGEFPVGEIDVLYHFAWTGVKPEDRDLFDEQIKNIGMTMECMKLAAAIKIKRIVFPGSTCEYLYYGRPLDRNAPPSPADAYGAAKTALRYLCGAYAEEHEIDFIYTIITGIYSSDRIDNNVISYTIKSLLRKEKPVLTKLEQLWDYIHIDDAVEALFLAGEKGKKNAVYAIGHGDNWELRRYIEIIHHLIDSSLPLGIGEIPYSGDVIPSSCIDLSEIQRDTGFAPRVDFKSGIAAVIQKIRTDMGIDTQ